MHDKENHQLPEQIEFTDEKRGSDKSKTTIAERRKLVGVTREADSARLEALEYLGRRWLSHR
ncbi:hypothetical protein CN221_29430 [Sinorhizobium meliloti]|uniref:hypothetical protein n=1 Tax=Sinorhizobium TaxID=28105 RepID=UPI000FE0C3B0|nr:MULTISPECIES: hypothetical protein [Sinorhizobium]RVG87174.1 hypothetical protein CN221_29430 [Sinorhizobium meliloti]RVH58410.1 hypothetical protein CN209_28200 [Sinorhizobium meliloti]WQO44484.1 hypothetical protein U8C42_14830 [Sinorhizobium medicae]WQO51714.1 hypothetical protein U8C36_17660 [Sinorhizobium medicae]WQO59484.1 hypothetical protein U8C35_03205 [Sinorhizobium medicae]